jgi:hypothetical protein
MHIEPWMIIYVMVKMFAYTFWSYIGIINFAPKVKHTIVLSFLYGIIRLSMGFFLGVLIFIYALKLNNAIDNSFLTYLVIYVPARILEWSLMFIIISRNFSNLKYILLWIVGGIIISCIADIPLGFVSNWDIVPHGRPLC